MPFPGHVLGWQAVCGAEAWRVSMVRVPMVTMVPSLLAFEAFLQCVPHALCSFGM